LKLAASKKPSPRLHPNSEDSDDDEECVICMERERDIMFFPCAHYNFCAQWCARCRVTG
jgi:hypothetical protein